MVKMMLKLNYSLVAFRARVMETELTRFGDVDLFFRHSSVLSVWVDVTFYRAESPRIHVDLEASADASQSPET